MFAIVLAGILSLQITPEPITVQHTPNSILDNPPDGWLQYAGDRTRYSTMTGCAWLEDDRHILTANYLANTLRVYSFDPENENMTLVSRFDNSHKLCLNHPQNIAFSEDYKFLSIPNMGSYTITIYHWNGLEKPPTLLHTIHGHAPHGTTFSPCGNYLVAAFLESPGKVRVYKLTEAKKRLKVQCIQTLHPCWESYRPKSITFTEDGRYAVIGICDKIGGAPGKPGGALLSYRFDQETGLFDPEPISIIQEIDNVETVKFLSGSNIVVAVDQLSDEITAHEYNPETGEFGASLVALKAPLADMNLPHGVAITSDDQFMAVTNYGDDKLSIYEITRR